LHIRICVEMGMAAISQININLSRQNLIFIHQNKFHVIGIRYFSLIDQSNYSRNFEVIICYGTVVHISQLIQYSRACGSHHDFHDRGLLLTRKLLNQGFLLVKLKSLLRKFCGRHHDLVRISKYIGCFKSPW
jgi:hypothetical protein